MNESSLYRLERNGKPVFLSNKDMRLTYLLSSMINVNDEDVDAFIKWTETAEQATSRQQLSDTLRNTPHPIARFLSLKDIALCMYGRNKREQIEEVRAAINRLKTIEQVQIIGKAQVQITASLLMKDFDIKNLSAEDTPTEDKDVVRVVFGTIFLWNLHKRFSYLSPKVFEIWGKRGSGTKTQLFGIIFSTITSICYFHQRAAMEARARLKNEFRQSELTPKEKEEKLQQDVTEALTYRESFDYIKSRIETDYSSTKQYKAKFKGDLQSAIKALKQIGIITDGGFTRGKKGDDMAYFVVNEHYGGQKLLPQPTE